MQRVGEQRSRVVAGHDDDELEAVDLRADAVDEPGAQEGVAVAVVDDRHVAVLGSLRFLDGAVECLVAREEGACEAPLVDEPTGGLRGEPALARAGLPADDDEPSLAGRRAVGDLLETLHRRADGLETRSAAREHGRTGFRPDGVGESADRAGDLVESRAVSEPGEAIGRGAAGDARRVVEIARDDPDDAGEGHEIGDDPVARLVRPAEDLTEQRRRQQVGRRQDAEGFVDDDEGFQAEVVEGEPVLEPAQDLLDELPEQAGGSRRSHRWQGFREGNQLGVRQQDVDAVIVAAYPHDRLDRAAPPSEERVAHREILDGDRDVVGRRQGEEEEPPLAQGVGHAESAPRRVVAEDRSGLVPGDESLFVTVVLHRTSPRYDKKFDR